MLLMVEKGIRGGICQATYRYANTNNKYMNNHDKRKIISYLMYLDANNLYGWAMSQKPPVDGFKWVKDLFKFNKDFIKNYDENSDRWFFLEVDVEHPKSLFNFHKDLPYLPERKKLEKVKKLVCGIEDKKNYVVHIRALKQALNHGLLLKRVHRVIQFNQKAWLKPYIDMNTKLRKEAKIEFEKDFFKLVNNAVVGKTMENVRNKRDIKLVTADEERNELVSEPNYRTTKHFSENLLVIEMKKTKVIMNKPLYLGMPTLGISKTLMYEFWYDYIKYGDIAKLCYMDTDSFVIYIITEDFYEDIANDIETWFDTSNYDGNDKRPLPIGKNKKVIGLFKDELVGKITEEFCALRAKTYSYLINGYKDGAYDKEKIINKKAKGTKKCVIKRRLMFENYKDCLLNDKIIIKSQQRFKSDHHVVYTVEVNKIALSSNDDKRLQTLDKVTTYRHGTNVFKVCKSEAMLVRDLFVKKYADCPFYDKIKLQPQM